MDRILVYDRVLIDMSTMRVLEADTHWHEGEVAMCGGGKGGGGSTTHITNEVDKEYNARIAAIQERAQDLSDKYFAFWEQNQAQLEAAQIQKELTNVDQQDAIVKQQLNIQQTQNQQMLDNLYQQGLITKQQLDLAQAQNQQALDTQAAKEKIEDTSLSIQQTQLNQQLENLAQQGFITKQQLDLLQGQNQQALDTLAQKNLLENLGLDLSQKQAENALGNIDQENRIYQGILGLKEDNLGATSELTKSFLNESLDGVNKEEWANRAGVDQQAAASNANAQLARNAARMGLNANSGKFATAMADQATTNAANIATARTKAYRDADNENYKRLQTGMSAGLGLLK